MGEVPPGPPELDHDAPPLISRDHKPGHPADEGDFTTGPLDRDTVLPFPFTITLEVRTRDSLRLTGVEGSEVYAAVREHFAREAPGKSATAAFPGPTWSQDRGLPQTPPVRIVQHQAPFDRWGTVRFNYGDIHVEVEGAWLESYVQDPSTWPTEEEVIEACLPDYLRASREDTWLPPWGELVLEPLRGCWNLPRTNTHSLFWRGNTWGGAYMVLEHALRLIGAFYEHARDKDSGFAPGAAYHRWLRRLISGRDRHPTTGRLFARLCGEDERHDESGVSFGGLATVLGLTTPYISLRGEDARFPDAQVEVVPGMDECGVNQGFPKVSSRPWDDPWYEPVRVESDAGAALGSGEQEQQFYWLPRGSKDGDLDHDKPASVSWPSSRGREWPEWLYDGAWVKGNGGGVNPGGSARQLNLRAARLHFDGLVTDELLWWAGAALRYSQEHPSQPQPAQELARFAFYRVLQWSSALLHELGHVYCNPGDGGHCLSAGLFMNHARGRFLCKVTKLLGLRPTSTWDPAYGLRPFRGHTTGRVEEGRQTIRWYQSTAALESGQQVACILRDDGGMDYWTIRSDESGEEDREEREKGYNPSWCCVLGPGVSLAQEGWSATEYPAALEVRARFRMPECVPGNQSADASYTSPAPDCEHEAPLVLLDEEDPFGLGDDRFQEPFSRPREWESEPPGGAR